MAVVFSEANPAFQHEVSTHQMSPAQAAAFFAFEQARRAYTTTRGESLIARAVAGMEGTLGQIQKAVAYERRSFIDAAKRSRALGIPLTLIGRKIGDTKTPLAMMAALPSNPLSPHRLR